MKVIDDNVVLMIRGRLCVVLPQHTVTCTTQSVSNTTQVLYDWRFAWRQIDVHYRL